MCPNFAEMTNITDRSLGWRVPELLDPLAHQEAHEPGRGRLRPLGSKHCQGDSTQI